MQRKPTARSALTATFLFSASLVLAGDRPADETASQVAPRPVRETASRVPAPDAQPVYPEEDGGRPAAGTTAGEAGLRVRLDPQTGELSAPGAGPADEERAARFDGPSGRLNTYGGDLIQEALPGGGFRVDLRGRFQSSVVATIDPETDEVTIDCVTTTNSAEAADDG